MGLRRQSLTRKELEAEHAAQAQEIADLKARIQELEAGASTERGHSEAETGSSAS